MMLRKSLLLGFGLFAIVSVAAGGSQAQQRRPSSREDLLDELTRHIQICSEISDSQQRLACYDRVQTHVGDIPAPAPQPTPLASNPPPAAPPPAAPPPPAFSGGGYGNPANQGGSYSSQPLAPPPLNVPGGGVATLGQGPQSGGNMAPPPQGYAAAGPPPQQRVTRTGPRPVPYSSQPMPLVTLRAYDLKYGASSPYWQVTIAIISNTQRSLDTQVQCTFVSGDSPVGDATFGPTSIAPGEQITADLIGPPTSTHVDSTNCRVLSP